jgi:RNA polymerase II-associated protein 2
MAWFLVAIQKHRERRLLKLSQRCYWKEEDDDMLSSCRSDPVAKQLENIVLEEKKGAVRKRKQVKHHLGHRREPSTRPAVSDRHGVNFTSTIIIGDVPTSIDQGTMDQYNYISSPILGDNHPPSSQHAVEHWTEAHWKRWDLHLNLHWRFLGARVEQSVTWADDERSVLETIEAFDSHSSGTKPFGEGIDSSVRRAAALIEAAEVISSGT